MTMTTTTTTSARRLALVFFLLLNATVVLFEGVTAAEEKTCSAVDGTCAEAERTTKSDATDTTPHAEASSVDADVASAVHPHCHDQHEKCEFWARYAECEKNPKYMVAMCPESCKTCIGTIDLKMGVPQTMLVESARIEEVQRRIVDARDYVNFVMEDPKHSVVREGCKNEHASCAYWATLGECDKNPGYMKTNCAPVCQSCDQLSVTMRCQAGDMNRLFERLSTMSQYEPAVYSRPSFVNGDTEDTASYIVGPWVLTLENVVSQEEANRLIELGAEEGYKRSSDVGKLKWDGTFESNVNDRRTSTNAWCQHSCYEDPKAKAVIDRISNLTGIPETNSEYLQLLKYEPGQFYGAHHDYILHHRERQQGVRMLTVFLYLNDVEEGGGTNFPKYNLTVQPKRGRALLWPSVLDDDPHTKDPRTEHEALPVIKGIKYGANAWFHARDFKTPLLNHCT